jgi:hypothetical protein
MPFNGHSNASTVPISEEFVANGRKVAQRDVNAGIRK